MANKGIHKYSVQESQNFQLGQTKSQYLNTTSQNLVPASGSVFVAIQIVADAKFNTLTAEFKDYCFGDNGTDNTFDGTGVGDQVHADDQFPSGMVIYGRWSLINIAAGVVIAYEGK